MQLKNIIKLQECPELFLVLGIFMYICGLKYKYGCRKTKEVQANA